MSIINVDQIRSQSFIGAPVDVNGIPVTYAIGSGTIGLGQASLQSCTGPNNVAVGKNTLVVLTTGDDNTAVGGSALQLTTGNNNTAVGFNAGALNSTGTNNTFIGFLADGSTPTSNNTITLGNSAIATLRCQATSITSLSDARDKTNIEESDYGIDFVNSLKPVKFEWDTRDGAKKGVKDLGFIAQDLKELDDEHLNLVYDENPDKLEATYGRLIPVLVKAIQDLSKEIEILKSK